MIWTWTEAIPFGYGMYRDHLSEWTLYFRRPHTSCRSLPDRTYGAKMTSWSSMEAIAPSLMILGAPWRLIMDSSATYATRLIFKKLKTLSNNNEAVSRILSQKKVTHVRLSPDGLSHFELLFCIFENPEDTVVVFNWIYSTRFAEGLTDNCGQDDQCGPLGPDVCAWYIEIHPMIYVWLVVWSFESECGWM